MPADNHKLEFHLETDLSQPLVVGKGTLLYLHGWCYHPTQKFRELYVLLDDQVICDVPNHSLIESDVLRLQAPDIDQSGNSLVSGFFASVPIRAISAPTEVELQLKAKLVNGQTASVVIGKLQLLPDFDNVEHITIPVEATTSAEPLIVIAMASFNPPLHLFEEQIASIIAQTHQNWRLIITDDHSRAALYQRMEVIVERDSRISLFRNPIRLGFYHNFERALSLVPAEAQYVAMADQDDRWYPEKLTKLLGKFGPKTTLVYSDMQVVSPNEEVLSKTFWVDRKNNYTNLETMFMANSITGAASMIRRSLIEDILPFPPRIGHIFHDHWIACAALAKGEIGYVDQPLYDYVQHGNNVLGHGKYATHGFFPSRADMNAIIRTPRGAVGQIISQSRAVYARDVARIAALAKTIVLRFRPTNGRKRALVQRFAKFDRSLGSIFVEGLKYQFSRRPSLGSEWLCFRGALITKTYNRYLSSKSSKVYHKHIAELNAPAHEAPQAAAVNLDTFNSLLTKTAPLHLNITGSREPTVNLLIPTVDFKYLFGGYIGKFNLGLKLAAQGYHVRLVIVDYSDFNMAAWRRGIAKFQGLEDLFDRVEVAYVADRSIALNVNPHDVFVASTWWTAHIAHAASQELDTQRFIYLIQEYEPMTFAMGSFYAAADETYDFPHNAIFSTELLRDYFRQNRLGVFRESVLAGEERSVSFQNAINAFHVSYDSLHDRDKHKLLFYARPEQHAARNMFELGLASLIEAISDGYFNPNEWEFHGIGTVGSTQKIKLSQGASLTLLPRVSLQDYVEILPKYDVGLSLMLTPHPSLVPIEMASAGLLTVTNTYANKTAAQLAKISSNLIATPPTLLGVKAGLIEAVTDVDNIERRLLGADVDWATTWEDAFGPEVLPKILGFIRQINATPELLHH